MKKSIASTLFISLLLSASFVMARPAVASQKKSEAQEQEKLAREAKITKDEAQATALKRAPGTVESSELEREHGKLVYSFDIRNAKGTITEVQVNAITGKIARVEHENKKQEAREKKNEKH